MKANTAPKVGMISLGCAKNLVDAEIMLGGIVKEGMQITSDADEADVMYPHGRLYGATHVVVAVV
jgi:ribosomal protein S12 methylthiotransferase